MELIFIDSVKNADFFELCSLPILIKVMKWMEFLEFLEHMGYMAYKD